MFPCVTLTRPQIIGDGRRRRGNSLDSERKKKKITAKRQRRRSRAPRPRVTGRDTAGSFRTDLSDFPRTLRAARRPARRHRVPGIDYNNNTVSYVVFTIRVHVRHRRDDRFFSAATSALSRSHRPRGTGTRVDVRKSRPSVSRSIGLSSRLGAVGRDRERTG